MHPEVRAFLKTAQRRNMPLREIKRMRDELAKKHHPDKQRTAEARARAEEIMRDINLAYETLTL